MLPLWSWTAEALDTEGTLRQEGGERMDTWPLDQARSTGCLSGPPARLQRRQLLQAALTVAAAGLVGCGRRSAAPSRASAAAPVTLGLTPPLPPPNYQEALMASFSAHNPGYRIVYSSASDPAAKDIQWWLVQSLSVSGSRAQDTIDLGPALKSLNFNESVIDATVWNAFLNGGTMTAMPTELIPRCIGYWPEAFAAARIPMPAPSWTWDDFLRTCSELQAAINAGYLEKSGFVAVMPRMSGNLQFFKDNFTSAVSDPNLWMAFIAGYGGAFVSNGFAMLNTPSAVSGVTQLVEMVHDFALDPQAPAPNSLALPPGAALGFETFLGRGAASAQGSNSPRFARFPRLPKKAVIPAQLGGRALHDNPNSFSMLPRNLDVPAEILDVAARYFIWLYQDPQQRMLAKTGRPPIVANAELQKSFWGSLNMDVTASDFVFPEASWSYADRLGWDWLEPAVIDPGEVPDLLTQAANTINAAIAAQRASAGKPVGGG